MRTIAIQDFGGPEVMQVADLPVPRLGENEVRVRIAYGSVNPADWKLREGWLRKFDVFRPSFPFVMGYDGAGVVDAVGSGVSGLGSGDRVLMKSDQSIGRWGTFAEFLVVAADVVGTVPRSMALSEAATIPVAGLTAWHGLFHHGRLEPGEGVFIHAGSGGVGSFAVQFARHQGAHVFASCRPENASYLGALGAERTFDHGRSDMVASILGASGRKLDLVVDAIGGDRHDLPALLKQGGRYVRIPTLGAGDATPTDAAIAARGTSVIRAGIIRGEARAALAAIGALFEAGKLVIPEIEMFPIKDVGRALELSKAGRKRGKMVLEMWT